MLDLCFPRVAEPSTEPPRLHTDWGDLPWRSYVDPSGNEFCILPARA